MRWIYLSPHFDDAVLSCGGLIWEQTHSGTPVEIWTICAGMPLPDALSEFATATHKQWKTGSAQDTVSLRRQEDEHAARILDASAHHFPIADCIYRRSRQGAAFYTESVFVAPHPQEESDLTNEISRLLSQRLTASDTLVCPLAIGGHVDHRLVRAAAEKLRRPLWYYADVPYVINHPEELPQAAQNKRSKPGFVSPAGLRAWQEAIAAYASQVPSLFESSNAMRSAIRDYLRQNEGVLLYRDE
jgi:LmbE family N-acetylglucosaminyl deacetylase